MSCLYIGGGGEEPSPEIIYYLCLRDDILTKTLKSPTRYRQTSATCRSGYAQLALKLVHQSLTSVP